MTYRLEVHCDQTGVGDQPDTKSACGERGFGRSSTKESADMSFVVKCCELSPQMLHLGQGVAIFLTIETHPLGPQQTC